ncbi:ankyrin repeat domain-containing protein [Flavobacterium sp. HSC-61S13]|uniref:ankyrin repeat domain-containing protein n=1 Tax=Flavobacterium sp. HSC-61S13 TaxID=2910963 RepID=UPI00209DA84E|nr:ankyrin repeat domain-containing protein [Flavobacterium sp. HSC-61S13]MCP1996085.1 ankyrin repeat protein [Flavobacterium sp. HSC-61S13]
MRKNFFLFVLAAPLSMWSCTASSTENTEVMTDQEIVKLVQNNDVNAVAQALKAGAKVQATDSDQRSLLLIATVRSQIEMAKLLVKHGADVNQQALNLDSAFLYAGATGQTELVKLYLDHGARFDVFNRYNGTALIPACERGHVETVRLLANTKDFPIDHINRLQWTGLMEAVVLGDGSVKFQQIVQILKEAGADLSIPDRDGITALQHAKAKGYKEIEQILKI